MVKGVNKRVIVVRAPDPRLFEQAIFIIREDALTEGVSAEEVLSEAQRAAKNYVRYHTGPGKKLHSIPAPVWAAAGALMTAAAWGLTILF